MSSAGARSEEARARSWPERAGGGGCCCSPPRRLRLSCGRAPDTVPAVAPRVASISALKLRTNHFGVRGNICRRDRARMNELRVLRDGTHCSNVCFINNAKHKDSQ